MVISRHSLTFGFFSMLYTLVVVGCGSSSTGGGAGGALGSGGTAKIDAGSDSGRVGSGGAGGSGGSTGSLDAANDIAISQPDAAADSPAIDAAIPTLDGSVETGLDGGATLAQIKALVAARCAACHTGTGAAATRINFTDDIDAGTSLYARLLAPLLLETYCGENVDAGGDAAQPRRAVVPGDPGSSFLYLKITGTEPSPGTPPANCGSRMPRVLVPGVDGGAATMPSCDSLDGGAAANCLGAADIDLVRQWILEGAPQ